MDPESTAPSAPQRPVIGTAYPSARLARALLAAEAPGDADSRERAARRVARWSAFIQGQLSGTIKTGSRTPLSGVPAWVTPEVLAGGFCSGALLAGGALRPHELARLDGMGVAPAQGRLALNLHFLTEQGLAELLALLDSRRYAVELPEEGALLVVAWLAGAGHAEEAWALVELLSPWFSRLRFYPVPCEAPAADGVRVCLEHVAAAKARLRAVRPSRPIQAQKEAIEVWAPLYDRMVALFLETVSGEAPRALRAGDGGWLRSADGRFSIQGGWPCAHYPPGWTARAGALIDEVERQRRRHRLCGRPWREKRSFAPLLAGLGRCVGAPQALDGREVGRIRLILARYVGSRGLPDSPERRALRGRQVAQAAAPGLHELAGVLAARLDAREPDAGLDDPAGILRPVEAGEGEAAAGTPIPPALRRKVERCRLDTLAGLFERGLVPSGETLAQVLPQLSAGLRARGFPDPALGDLQAAIHRAFRRRRSVLLLDLQQQVRLQELPWVAAVEPWRGTGPALAAASAQALKEVSQRCIEAFAQAPLPNKLLQELRLLAEGAGLALPLLE